MKMVGLTALFIAAGTAQANLEIVTFLVEAGAAKDQAANDGATPLFAAAQEGQLETVRFLVEVGAATDQATKDGSTPLADCG